MPRIRTVKPELFKNEELAELPASARLLFIGLFCLADKEGKLEDRPKRIKAEIFPYDNVDVHDQLIRLQSAGFIKRENGFIKVIPGECMGTIRSFNLLDTNIKEWIKIRHIVFERIGKQCAYCGNEEGPFQIDHIVPVSKGGTDELENLTVACRRCNIRKKDLTVSQFLKKYNLSYAQN